MCCSLETSKYIIFIFRKKYSRSSDHNKKHSLDTMMIFKLVDLCLKKIFKERRGNKEYNG